MVSNAGTEEKKNDNRNCNF